MELIILTGHRKSGTTMLHRLFDNHNGINLYPVDISVLYAYFPYFTKGKNLSEDELKSRLNHVLKQSMEPIYDKNYGMESIVEKYLLRFNHSIKNRNLRSKADVINAIYEAWIASQSDADESLPFVFKETSQAIYFKYFKNHFPNLKMVSLVRDPRDNFASIRSGIKNYYSKFGEGINSALASVINRARLDLKSAEINQKNFSDSFLAIRYEDLVSNPEETMRKVSTFLSIDFSKSMLIPTIMGEVYKGNNFEGKKFSAISNEQVGKWIKRITKDEAMIIEYWLADIMKTWGYEPKYRYDDSQCAFSEFYEWYNCEYFYHDSFQTKK